VTHPGPASIGLDVLRRSAVAFAVALGAGLAVGPLQLAAGGADSVTEGFMGGALVFLLFHHVGVEAVTGGGTEVGSSLGVALMLGTALAGWLLFRAGRAVGDRAGGGTLRRALVGASVAVPYALLAFGLTLLVRADLRTLPLFGASAAELRPDPLSALWWTLLLGVVAGGAGGLEAAPDRAPEGGGGLIRAVAAGGRRMAWTAVALSFVALMVLVALRPEATRAYVHSAFSSGPADGALTMAATAAVAPNVATGVLAVAAGGSVEVGVAGRRCTVISYGTYPLRFDPGAYADACAGDLGTAPPWFFLLLVVPLVAAVRGGHRGAVRAGPDRARRAVAAGVWAGLAGAAAVAALMVLATVSIQAAGPAGLVEGSVSVGPDIPVSGGLTALWGAVGGAAGGYRASSRAGGRGEPGPTGGSSRPGAQGAGGAAGGGGPAAGPPGGAAVLLSWNRSQAP
jgi:hypothetical protein